MKAIRLKQFGAPENLYLGEYDAPQPNAHEILVKVAATALNRADTLQRKGNYPPPKGASPILGLEMAGKVIQVGEKVNKWKIGDNVCGLLAGGGYAEYAVIHENMAMPVPKGLTLEQAAGIPEVFLTAFQALNWLAKLQAGENVLIHAGASGVGTAAIQLARAMEASKILVTASAGKHKACLDLKADVAIDYKTQDFQTVVLEHVKGVDVVMDFLAAPYFQRNINVLNMDGRMVLLALMGGVKIQNLNVARLLTRRLHIMGSTLRSRTLAYKIALTQDFAAFALPLFAQGVLKPVIDSVFDWREVVAAHQYMEANRNIGKIILQVN